MPGPSPAGSPCPRPCRCARCRGEGTRAAGAAATSIPDITRLLARIAEWQEGHGKAGGRADAARRLDEIRDMLTEMRRGMLGKGQPLVAPPRLPPFPRRDADL